MTNEIKADGTTNVIEFPRLQETFVRGGIKFRGKTIGFSVPIFSQYIQPHGFLDTYMESHAAFYYYLCAKQLYDENIKETPIVYEGHQDPIVSFKNILLGIARLYEVLPENILKCHHAINMQCLVLKLDPLPDQYWHNPK